MAEWQPIETAPTDGTIVILWAHDCGHQNDRATIGAKGEMGSASMAINGEPVTAWFSVEEQLEGHDEDGYWMTLKHIVPTHWMPLPSPPE